MSKKDNLSLGVRQEFDDIDYWHKLPKNKFVTLKNGKKISIYEYMKKYMHESYANNFSRSDPESNILQTEEHKREARRNNNNTNRDALNVIKKSGKMSSLFYVEEGNINDNPEPWEDAFKYGELEQSFDQLMQMTAQETGLPFTKKDVSAILRMYFRIRKFLQLMRKDRQNNEKKCEKCNKTKLKTDFYRHGTSKDGRMKKCANCVKGER
jgi:hypothetical protein